MIFGRRKRIDNRMQPVKGGVGIVPMQMVDKRQHALDLRAKTVVRVRRYGIAHRETCGFELIESPVEQEHLQVVGLAACTQAGVAVGHVTKVLHDAERCVRSTRGASGLGPSSAIGTGAVAPTE